MEVDILFYNGVETLSDDDFHTIVEKDGEANDLRVWHSDPDHPENVGDYTNYPNATIVEIRNA